MSLAVDRRHLVAHVLDHAAQAVLDHAARAGLARQLLLKASSMPSWPGLRRW
jgi:hypothetical protein